MTNKQHRCSRCFNSEKYLINLYNYKQHYVIESCSDCYKMLLDMHYNQCGHRAGEFFQDINHESQANLCGVGHNVRSEIEL